MSTASSTHSKVPLVDKDVSADNPPSSEKPHDTKSAKESSSGSDSDATSSKSDKLSTSSAPQEVLQEPHKFPVIFYTKSPWALQGTWHLRDGRTERLFAARKHSGLSRQRAGLCIYDGPTENHPVLVRVLHSHLDGFRPAGTIIMPARPEKGELNALESVISKTEPDPNRSRMFYVPWRKTREEVVREGGRGLIVGWKLLHLSGPGFERMVVADNLPEPVIRLSPDDRETVATMGQTITQGFHFAFKGSGLSGKFGERWEIAAVASGLWVLFQDSWPSWRKDQTWTGMYREVEAKFSPSGPLASSEKPAMVTSPSTVNLSALHAIVHYLETHNWQEVEKRVHPRIQRNGQPQPATDFFALLSFPPNDPSRRHRQLDSSLLDISGDAVALRLIHCTNLDSSSDTVYEYAEIVFAWFTNGRLARWQSLCDEDAARARKTTAPRTPHHPDITSRPSPDTTLDLKHHYRAYIKSINDGTMERDFGRFCQPELDHNGRRLSIAEYIPLISDSQEAIRDLRFDIQELLVDDATQQIAARLEFTGTPVREWGGAKPNGHEVRFHEHVMYQLDGGKIGRVWSVIELDAYRSQLS
ncbi:hypothetical protein C8034_v002643 [Colletotrichum sidae]|uniref:SnoaL-like polyketide cyclase n=1 Tax=Colletotrichum sidae TaxID=1347389 RepID=A0A4V3I2N4_9PEZI|nr:hypothetical protein C8034_v002643 [Colletotrichum sidae]